MLYIRLVMTFHFGRSPEAIINCDLLLYADRTLCFIHIAHSIYLVYNIRRYRKKLFSLRNCSKLESSSKNNKDCRCDVVITLFEGSLSRNFNFSHSYNARGIMIGIKLSKIAFRIIDYTEVNREESGIRTLLTFL